MNDATGTSEVLLQYGAIGAILVLSIAFMLVLHRQSNKRADAQIVQAVALANKERERADRLEEALARQNTVIQEKIIPLTAEMGQAAQLFSTLAERVVASVEAGERK